MNIWMALAPLAVLAGGMAVFNLTAWRAGLATLLLLLGLSWVGGWQGSAPAFDTVWARALQDALVLAGTVAYTLFFGLLLHQLMDRGGALAVLLQGIRQLGRNEVERLTWVLLVFGPLFESISGFGLAVVIIAPMLLGLGYGPVQTMALSLISQLAVPWGALAIGMVLGAAMAELPLEQVGAATAVVAAPGYVLFWLTALYLARPKDALGLVPVLRSAAALAVFSVAVWAANRWISAELGGVVGAASLGAWLWFTGAGPTKINEAGEVPVPRNLLRAAAPYLGLVALLVASRFWDAARTWLNTHGVIELPGANFALPVLYNQGTALAIACVITWRLFPPGTGSGGTGGATGSTAGGISAALGATFRQWLGAARAVLLLILVARGMVESGMTEALAVAGGRLPPLPGAIVMSLLAGAGGFLTGSVAAANALFINLQVGMATGLGFPPLWAVAVQTAVSAGFTALSPARIVFAATLTGRFDQEGAVLRKLLPLGLGLVLVGTLVLLAAAFVGEAPTPPF